MTTRYVDAATGSDLNDGLTTGAAKLTPYSAMLASSAGDKILIKTGYCYSSSSGKFLFFSGVSNVEVGTYGTASDKPILDGLTYQNPGVAGWTYVSGGIWKKTFASFYIRRLWVGSTSAGNVVGQRILGTAKRRAYGIGLTGTSANPSEATILAGLSSSMIWFGGGSTTSYALYVYTGSAVTDPPTYYGGIAFIQSDGSTVGSVAGVYVQNQTGIYVHDLHFRGNGGTGIRLQAQNSDTRSVADCLFEDCIVTAPYQGAFLSRIAGEATPTKTLRSTTVRRVYLDYTSSSDETEPNQSYDNLSGISDGFSISDGSVSITVEDCTSIDPSHQGIVAGSTVMRTSPPSGCKFLDNLIQFSSWSVYGRGISNYDGDTLFRGNLIDGQNTRSQFAGSATVTSNIWINMRDSVRKPDVAEWCACESYMLDTFTTGIGNERYIRVQPAAVLISNNTIYSPVDASISFNFYDKSSLGEGDNSFAAGAITVQNNIVHSPMSTFIRTYEDSTKTINTQVISKNCVYNGSTGDSKITWRGSSYAINTAPGSTSNLEVNPGLDAVHRPSHASLKRAGTALSGKDYYGKTFYSTPNIGAVEDHPTPAWAAVAQ